mgnify:FL=1
MKRVIEVYDITRMITEMMEINAKDIFDGKVVS